MPARNDPLSGDELLVAVTKATVAFHERYYHRKPVTAKTPQDPLELAPVVTGLI